MNLPEGSKPGSTQPYAFAIFAGAFLLFQVEPMIGKYILPWFGGGPGVWTTCLLFFQVLLLGGYAYAHLLSSRFEPRRQAIVHGCVLVACLVLLPIVPSTSWESRIGGSPTWHILLLLAGTIGLPFFALSATGPLVQSWFGRANPGRSPYRLYALSNAGSLLALLTYPVVFESAFSRTEQANLWSAGFVVFSAVCGICAWLASRTGAAPPEATSVEPSASNSDVAIPAADRLLWVVLPAIASVLLLATTNKLCQDVAVIPFLWVLPLGLYLSSFVICFDHERWYRRGPTAAAMAAGIVVGFQLLASGNLAPLWLQIPGYSAILFVACLFCHGELFRLRPAPRRLTGYYLSIAAGGALGGILVAIVAPAIFDDYRELPIGMWALTYVAGALCFRRSNREIGFGAATGLTLATLILPWVRARCDPDGTYVAALRELYTADAWYVWGGVALLLVCGVDWPRFRVVRDGHPRLGIFVMLASTAAGFAVVIQWHAGREGRLVEASRNFYGTLKVLEFDGDKPGTRYDVLLHGATTHGLQFAAPEKAMWPTTYYTRSSGAGLAIDHLRQPPGRRKIGLVGLGTGTLTSYGAPGDTFRVYEINPAVRRLATTRFTYLERCPAKVDIVMGDARLSMRREIDEKRPQRFDLLALDAFNSDAIPVHLLTREAFAIYLAELAPDGVLAVHTSNRYLNLNPVVERLAAEYGLASATIDDDSEPNWWTYGTTWILIARDPSFLDDPAIQDHAEFPVDPKRETPLWTDDHTSLYEIIRR